MPDASDNVSINRSCVTYTASWQWQWQFCPTGFVVFLVPHASVGETEPRPFPSTSLPINPSLITLPLDAIQSETLTVSLNSPTP
jgi:hypothetical protein